MRNLAIKKQLEHFILDNFVNFEEYQDKFYLKKRIQEIVPEKNDDIVYRAIEEANTVLKPPRKRTDYIRVLLENLQI